MSSIDQTRQQLIDSKLMTAETAEENIARWREQTAAPAAAPGEELIDWLVARQLLTEFQGEALRAGHTGPFMLGPYRVFERTAVGLLGNIYRAVHDELNQPVSLKVFPSSLKNNPEKVARMQREFRTTVELDHPNVVRSFHIGQVGEIYFLAFEDLKGETLRERLEREGALRYREACGLIGDAARGVRHIHEKGLVHRDVQPGNMWITEGGVLKIMELGAVRDALGGVVTAEDGEVTTSDTVIGAFPYMAPEQAQDAHAADHRSDIYSLGCTFYHCLAGRPPFVEKNPIRMVMRHATEAPAPVTDFAEDIPPQLAEAVDSMLAKSPEQRFQNASDVVWALEEHVDQTAPQPVQEDEIREEFLVWLQEHAPPVSPKPQAARSPELADFLGWLADGRPTRHRRQVGE